MPSLLLWLFSLPVSWFADWAISSKQMSVGKVRKICSGIGLFGPALFSLALSFSGCGSFWVVFWLYLAVMFVGANHSGLNVNLLELSPNYAGTLRGLVNTFYHISAFLAPIISGFIMQKYQSLLAWTTVFLIASGFFFCSGIVFILFGSSETQHWNNIDDNDDHEKDCIEKK